MNQPQDVAVDAAARGELGKDGRLHLLLPLLDDHLAGLPLPHHLLVALADLCIDLHSKDKSSDTAFQVQGGVCVCVCVCTWLMSFLCMPNL